MATPLSRIWSLICRCNGRSPSTGMIVSVGSGGTIRKPTASNPALAAASIRPRGSASRIVRWAREMRGAMTLSPVHQAASLALAGGTRRTGAMQTVGACVPSRITPASPAGKAPLSPGDPLARIATDRSQLPFAATALGVGPAAASARAASSIRSDHHIGGLDDRVSLLARRKLQLIDSRIGDGGRDNSAADVDFDVRRRSPLRHFNDLSLEGIACTDLHVIAPVCVGLPGSARYQAGPR